MTRYFDASALVKLFLVEDETAALVEHVRSNAQPAATSMIALAETPIAVARRGYDDVWARALADPRWLMSPVVAVHALDLTPNVVKSAARFGSVFGLRALDAIHVATAHAMSASLREVITYDLRMTAACESLGLPVVSPGA